MIIKLPGTPLFFAEGKIIKGNLFAPTPGQYEEGLRLQQAGLLVVLIGWKDGVCYTSPWVKKADYRECLPFKEWHKMICKEWKPQNEPR